MSNNVRNEIRKESNMRRIIVLVVAVGAVLVNSAAPAVACLHPICDELCRKGIVC